MKDAPRPLRPGAVVLAAGAARRFGSVKLIAPLEGRPLLQHVLDTLAVAEIGDVAVVLGRSADVVERAIAWRGESRVVNLEPERGIASSLRLGLAALAATVDAAFIVLGDQPRIRPDVLDRLVDAARRSDLPIVVPDYADGGGGNPVLVRRSAWLLAEGLEGDRGLGLVIAGRPELVLRVGVDGRNDDVDTPADLANLGRAEPASGRSGHDPAASPGA